LGSTGRARLVLGYPFALALMVVLGLSPYGLFKRRNWI
jgi:hypothetical protein